MKILNKSIKEAKKLFPYVFDDYSGGHAFHFAHFFIPSLANVPFLFALLINFFVIQPHENCL